MLAIKDYEKLEKLSSTDSVKYANFRANLRLLRYTTDLSAEALGKTLKFKKFHRIRALEEGRGAPIRLEKRFGTDRDFWIRREAIYREKLAALTTNPMDSWPVVPGAAGPLC